MSEEKDAADVPTAEPTLQEQCQQMVAHIVDLRVRYHNHIKKINDKICGLEIAALQNENNRKCINTKEKIPAINIDEDLIKQCECMIAETAEKQRRAVEKMNAVITVANQLRNDVNHKRITDAIDSETILQRVKKSKSCTAVP